MQSLFYAGDRVKIPSGAIGTVHHVRVKAGRTIYGVKIDPKFTARPFEDWELEAVED